MLTALAASIALASSLTLDVPYLPQSDALCGGAAAAMVFRYWGEAHASVDAFAALVDRHAGGIADAVLVGDIRRRGWNTERFEGSMARLRHRLAHLEPVIVLLADRGALYHYVVVVGLNDDRVVVHDPSWGPSRTIREREFLRLWEPSRFWALVIRPGDIREKGDIRLKADPTNTAAIATAATATAATATDPMPTVASATVVSAFRRTSPIDAIAEAPDRDRCDALVDRAIADSTAGGVAAADSVFSSLLDECPESPAPLHELAGIRFAQRRWHEAESLALQALARDSRDSYALDVLGSARFMRDDPIGALEAWNQIGKPRLDRVRIEGLRHARYQAIVEALDIAPGSIVTARSFAHARRRLDELPDRSTARLALRPDADGFAVVDVVIVERASIPRSAVDAAAIGASAAIDREVTLSLPGFTGQGEVWKASWRFWSNRPRVAVGLVAPRFSGMPGIWSVDASWEVQTFGYTDSTSLLRESRTHGGIAVTDWLTPTWRYALRGGVDRWNGDRRAASVGAMLERRLLRDRVSVIVDGERWTSIGNSPNFGSAGVRAAWMSPHATDGWAYAATAGLQRVGADAPPGLWPGAGEGQARGELLRAHPLLDDGVINVTGSTVFGRQLTFANAEAQRWLQRPLPARFGVALFADLANASQSFKAIAMPLQVDVGAGLRIRVPAANRVLRVDFAHGLRDGANAVTAGWVF
jgi:hypothetical protein